MGKKWPSRILPLTKERSMKDKKDITIKDGFKLYIGVLLAQIITAVGIIALIIIGMLILGAMLP